MPESFVLDTRNKLFCNIKGKWREQICSWVACLCVGLSPSFTSFLSTTHDLKHDLTMAGVSAEWLALWFPPLLKGADGSPHSTPVGFPPGKTRKHEGPDMSKSATGCFLLFKINSGLSLQVWLRDKETTGIDLLSPTYIICAFCISILVCAALCF